MLLDDEPFRSGLLRAGCGRGGDRDFYRIRLGPDFFAIHQLQTVHGDAELPMVNLDQQIVIVDLFALIRIGGGALDWIGVGAAPPVTK